MEIRIKRKMFRSFVEIILPPGFLVMVSWVSSFQDLKLEIKNVYYFFVNKNYTIKISTCF